VKDAGRLNPMPGEETESSSAGGLRRKVDPDGFGAKFDRLSKEALGHHF